MRHDEFMDESQKLWFAVLDGPYDDDWFIGSGDLEEAKEMARKLSKTAYIAVIANGVTKVQVGTIKRSDF